MCGARVSFNMMEQLDSRRPHAAAALKAVQARPVDVLRSAWISESTAATT
jgi:hypothetical protein